MMRINKSPLQAVNSQGAIKKTIKFI
jgi:hypothetical protein